MRLTSEQFEQMIHSLRGNRAGHERRATTRVGLRGIMDLRIKSGNRLAAFQTVRVRDISAGGVGIVTNVPMRPETEVVVYLSNDAGPMMLLQYTVMNSRRVGDQYIAGLRFDRKLASEEDVFTALPTLASVPTAIPVATPAASAAAA